MNHYDFKDCYLGMTAEFEIEISDDKIRMFRDITGDENPLHNDNAFARAHGYRGKVSFGLLTSSFASKLAGVFIPGELSLIHEVLFKYTKPVYAGDCLAVLGEVIEMDERTEQLTLKVRIRRTGDGEIVSRGRMIIGFLGVSNENT